MRVLSEVGLEIAPFQIVQTTEDVATLDPTFDGPYVVKLADVPHRTELGAVRLNVVKGELPQAVHDMREIALAHELSSSVVIQKQLRLTGEAFMGIMIDEQFGPIVLCGAGGILVELMRRMIGAIAPLSRSDIDWMLDELAVLGVFRGIRGSNPWDRARFGEAVAAVNRLATGASEWLAALDINPLGIWEGRYVVIDALLTTKDRATAPENNTRE
jgi:succinyl-CoA synthetase beta subunit